MDSIPTMESKSIYAGSGLEMSSLSIMKFQRDSLNWSVRSANSF